MKITCLNCAVEVTASPSAYRDVEQFDRVASPKNAASHIIMESGLSGSLVLHRCAIAVPVDPLT